MSFSLIQQELGLDDLNEEEATDQQMINAIAERVGDLLDKDSGLLMSYLYRLDVPEHKTKSALQQEDIPIPQALATLIWERQKQRLQTKRDIEVRKGEDMEGLEW